MKFKTSLMTLFLQNSSFPKLKYIVIFLNYFITDDTAKRYQDDNWEFDHSFIDGHVLDVIIFQFLVIVIYQQINQ